MNSNPCNPNRLNMNNKKITWLSILQGWAMLWVVIGHATLPELTTYTKESYICSNISNTLMVWAYSFHMPLFIMISGYLFYLTRIKKPMGYKAMIIDKAKRLGIPYFTFITAAFILKAVSIGKVSRGVEMTWEYFLREFLFPFESSLQEMWFIAAIFWFFLLREAYKQILKKQTLLVIVLIIAIGMNFIQGTSTTKFLAISHAIHFFIYFYIGMIIASQKYEKVLNNKYTIIINAIIFCVSFSIHNELLTALTGCCLFWGLANFAGKYCSQLFSSFREYTYQIFLLGIFVQTAIKIIYSYLAIPDTYIVFYILCILVGIYIPVIISKLIKRTNNKVLKLILGL